MVRRVVVVLASGRRLEASVGAPVEAVGGSIWGVEYVDSSPVASVVAFDAAGRQSGRSVVRPFGG